MIKEIIKENNKNIYELGRKDLILRDLLAVDRTILANERTFLSWIRTALSFIIGGVTLIKIFENKMIFLIGYSLIPIGFFLLSIGVLNYYKLKKLLNKILTS